MRFERKIFIALFCATFLIGSSLIWVGHRYASNKALEEFDSRYEVLNKVLADTLTRLDTSTESLMLNAARVAVERDAQKGLLSTEELKKLSVELGVTHFFVVNKDGNFIRSTNENPSLIPNLFSFCADYPALLKNPNYTQDATPIIGPMPEPKPYKFLFVPNLTKTRIIEVGVRVDSIAKTLMEAIKADPSVMTMSLYSPKGNSFGTFSANKIDFNNGKAILPQNLNSSIDDGDKVNFYSKVESSHTHCCQCDLKGTSTNGEYYYVLKSSVSKAELLTVQARMRMIFAILAVGNLILAFGIAKLVSRRLVKNIRETVSRVRSIKASGSITERINLQGEDEVWFLTQEFDKLLDQREESQRLLVEAEKAASKVQLAKVVAHNIRSPLLAIEMMIPQMFMLPERTRRVLANSVNEIKDLSDQLKSKPETLTVQDSNVSQVGEFVFLPILIEDVIDQKRIEYSRRQHLWINFDNQAGTSEVFMKVVSSELRSVLSNLINNAIESYRTESAEVAVVLSATDKAFLISICDRGCGISDDVRGKLGKLQTSSKEGDERGFGLLHAVEAVDTFGGNLQVKSNGGRGTEVTIELPRQERPKLLRRIIDSVAWQ
jgi:signal transduction histidine kinase